MTPPSLWALIGRAQEIDGARSLILCIGKQPMVRAGEEGLQPLGDDPPLTFQSMTYMLSGAIEPERWNYLERAGEGEVTLSRGTGRPITMTVFRASETWSAVVHL